MLFENIRLNGQIFREDDELFTSTSWVAVMMGQGIMPGGFNPMAAGLGGPELDNEVKGIEESIKYLVAQMPTHDAFLKQYCPAT